MELKNTIINNINKSINDYKNCKYDEDICNNICLNSYIIKNHNYIYKFNYSNNFNNTKNNIIDIIDNIENLYWNVITGYTHVKTDNYIIIDTIEKISLQHIYIKPIYISSIIFKEKENNKITIYQKFNLPNNSDTLKKENILIEDGLLKCEFFVDNDKLTICLFMYINIRLPKMISKLIGTFFIKKLINDIEKYVII